LDSYKAEISELEKFNNEIDIHEIKAVNIYYLFIILFYLFYFLYNKFLDQRIKLEWKFS
jgi:hypothetical protein